jgi:uncharacterized protein with HEPN domain
MRDDRERLLDILEAIRQIEKYSLRGEEAFRSDELIQKWMTGHIQVIGEAARSLSGEFRDRTCDVPWSDIIGMRNVLVHHYFQIDLDRVWQVVCNDLPVLKKLIVRFLEEL